MTRKQKPVGIPVIAGAPRVGSPDEFSGRPPVALVRLACDAAWAQAKVGDPQHNGKTYRALIDTGAESTAVDSAVALEIGAELMGPPVTLHTMGAPQIVRSVEIQIIFPKANLIFPAFAAVCEFRRNGQTFDLILGRSFLKNCRLRIDGPNGTYELLWIASE